MPSTKLYEGFVELGIDFSKFNADLARARSMLSGLGSGTAGGGFAAGVSAGVASGMAQGITSGSARARTAMSQVAAQGVAQGIAAGMAQTRSTVGRGMAPGGGGFGGVGSAAAGFAQGLGLPFSLNPAMVAGQLVGKGVDLITDGLRASLATAIQLEDTFTDLQRVSGDTAENVGGFKKVIFDIATTQAGSSVEDLTQIAGIGARMGVTDKEGMAGLETFTRGMAKVRNTVQGIGTEQLANDMGRMLNLFHKGTDYIEGFGSALAKMDQVSTSSASDILEMSKSLSGTFQSLQMTIPEVMAFSSVLADTGQTNQQGASSFSQVLRMMASQSEKFAGLIGVPAEQFQGMINTGQSMAALELLINKFKEINAVNPVQAQEFLVEFGFRGVKTAGAIQQLASMMDQVKVRTATANEEVRTLNALTTANELNSKTTAGAIGLFKNAVVELGDAVGKNLLGPLTDVTKQATAMVKSLSGVTPEVVGGITGAATGAVGAIPVSGESMLTGAVHSISGGHGAMIGTVAGAVFTGFMQGWTKAAANPPPPNVAKVFDAWTKEKQDQSPAAVRARMLEAETADNERRRAAAMAKSPRPLSLREMAEAEVGAKPEGRPGEALDEKLNVWNDTVNRHHQRLIDEQNERTVTGMRERMGEENLARFDMAQQNRPGTPVVKALMGDVMDAQRGGFKTMLAEARTDAEREAVVADQARQVRERIGMFGRMAAARFAGGGLAPPEKEKEEKPFRSTMFADPAEYARDAIGKALSTKEKDDEQKKTNDHLKDIKTDMAKFLGKALARGGAILQGRA